MTETHCNAEIKWFGIQEHRYHSSLAKTILIDDMDITTSLLSLCTQLLTLFAY